MFEKLRREGLLQHGMVVDGPRKGEVWHWHPDVIEMADNDRLPAVECNPEPPVMPLAFKVTIYHKYIYDRGGYRYYVWSVKQPLFKGYFK